jgi:hypothetical protein
MVAGRHDERLTASVVWLKRRLICIWLYRLFSSLLEALIIVKAETLVRRLRSSFRQCRSGKSRPVVWDEALAGMPLRDSL